MGAIVPVSILSELNPMDFNTSMSLNPKNSDLMSFIGKTGIGTGIEIRKIGAAHLCPQ